MEFKTAEEKLLHDYGELEDENARLEDENLRLSARACDLEKRLSDVFEQAHRLEVERDHHADCVKDMLATAKFYGFDQPQNVSAFTTAKEIAAEMCSDKRWEYQSDPDENR